MGQEKLLQAAMEKNRRAGISYIPYRDKIYIEPTNICNLACRFCAYRKASYKKQSMPLELFRDIVRRASKFGFGKFGLTPVTGEVLADKGFARKLEALESEPGVESYTFFTNFTLADQGLIDILFGLKKLKSMTISLYGHDRDSFNKITGGSPELHDRLAANIAYLQKKMQGQSLNLSFGLRSYNSFDPRGSILENLAGFSGVQVHVTKKYNNWGGLITSEDLKGLDMSVRSENDRKLGACSLIFYKNCIGADGSINACACRDVGRTMIIGDLKTQDFGEVYSMKNRDYSRLIAGQQKGEFKTACTGCDFYRSIYLNYGIYKTHEKRPLSIEAFFKKFFYS